ncbi:MAG: hypothetical protein LQ344_002107 [Seirophora lacunosa]|nr:MAG: hypothetical protein LQ344_002107 [Seirophora lacunosa]
MPAGLLPISYASIIVGFTGFAFTLFTFFRVFWDSIRTMWSAPKELRQLLDNVRTELYGERAYFKNAIKQAKSKSKSSTRETPEIAPLSILNDSIKEMMRDFRNMEAPFLDDAESSENLDIEKSGRVSLRGNYARMDFRRRYIWLQTKPDFIDVANQVTRMQTRRIAYETSNTLSCVRQVEKHILDLDDRIYALEEHFLGEVLEDGKVYVKRRYPKIFDIMRIFLCVCAVLAACAAWTPIVVKNVTELGPQISPDVTQVSRDGGYSVLLDGRIVWLYDDTECFDLGKKQLSFVSNTAAYAKDPDKNVSMLQDFGVEAVGKEKNSGITDYAILADKTVGTGGWIAFSDDELSFNKERKGRERVAIWPGTSPTPYSTTHAFMFCPLVYVDSKPKNPSKRYQARGMTLISISASSKGPIATRHGDLIISGNEIAYGGFTSLLGYTSTENPQDLDKRDVYLLGITDGGLQLARARQEVLTDFSKYRFWDPVELKFINTPPKVNEKDYKKIYLPGSFTYGSIFYSPYFNTFVMIYFNKFVDSTFRIRFLDLNNPVGQDPIWPKLGKHGEGIAPEDIEALVKYGWSPEQELYKSPPGKGGFNYAGMAHPEYFNRQYFALSLYPSSAPAGRRRNHWYGSDTVLEEDADGDGKHILLSWTSQLKGGFDGGVYQVQLAKVEFDAVPENPGGNFPSVATSSTSGVTRFGKSPVKALGRKRAGGSVMARYKSVAQEPLEKA